MECGQSAEKIKAFPDRPVCDILLDQYIFAGVGNIIKNEVLFRIKVHPESKIGKLAAKSLKALLDEAVNYSFDFLKWKKAFELKKHWLVHTKKYVPAVIFPLFEKIWAKPIAEPSTVTIARCCMRENQ